MVDFIGDLVDRSRVHNCILLRPVHDQKACKSAFCSRQGMIYKHVAPGAIDFEINHRRPAGGDAHRLHTGQSRGAEAATLVYMVKYLADDMKRGCRIRPADTKEYAHGLAHTRT
jgi:hypothetical protein